MTNGEKIIAILKPRKDQIRILGNWIEMEIQKLGINFSCELDWWNAEYKESTTKNDLGVDWESYKDVGGNSLDDLILEVLQNNFDCGNTYGYKVADEIISLLPSVTPQEPIEKCKWIKYDYRTMCPKGHDIDNPYWRIPQNRMETLKYCPYCGKEIEVEE